MVPPSFLSFLSGVLNTRVLPSVFLLRNYKRLSGGDRTQAFRELLRRAFIKAVVKRKETSVKTLRRMLIR